MSETPAVRCSCCFELVSWCDFPDHLDEHGGSLEIEAVAVDGEKPTMQAVGEYDTENCARMLFLE